MKLQSFVLHLFKINCFLEQPISTDSRSQKVTRKPTEKNQWSKATAALLDKSINGVCMYYASLIL